MTSHHDPRVKSRSPSPHPHPHPQYLDPSNTAPNPDPSAFYSPGYLPTNTAPQNLAPHGVPLAPTQSFDTGNFVSQLDQSSPNMPISPEENFSNLLNSNQADFDFALYQNTTSPSSTTGPEFDPPSLLDPQIHQQSRPSSQSINPADLVSPISSPQNPASPGPISPPSSAGPYYTPQHSRHTSLDPSTAAYVTGNSNDWQSMMGSAAFQGHRRAPSEVSDVSSVAHSPYMSQHESFDGVDNNNPSPLLAPQNDPNLFENTLGIESFTLSEHQNPQQLQGFSPAHSPYLSPQLMPQQGPEMVPSIPYISTPGDNNANPHYPNPPDLFGTDPMTSGDIGQASQMAPPSINVELAPPSKNPTIGPSKTTDIDSLSPPPREFHMHTIHIDAF